MIKGKYMPKRASSTQQALLGSVLTLDLMRRKVSHSIRPFRDLWHEATFRRGGVQRKSQRKGKLERGLIIWVHSKEYLSQRAPKGMATWSLQQIWGEVLQVCKAGSN